LKLSLNAAGMTHALAAVAGKTLALFFAACLVTCFAISLAHAQYVPSQTVVRNVDTIHVKTDGQAYKTVESMIRIDTPQGVNEDGERKLSFNEKQETLEILEAYTLQPNGTRVNVASDKIRKQDGESLDAYRWAASCTTRPKHISTRQTFPDTSTGRNFLPRTTAMNMPSLC